MPAGDFSPCALVLAAEQRLRAALSLAELGLPAGLAFAEGSLRGERVTIETRAYRGPGVRYARFARMQGAGVEVGNALCLPAFEHDVAMLGADLVGLGRETVMYAADLLPTAPAGPARDAQLEPLARRRAARAERWSEPLPDGGELPAWASPWFSPHRLYTRVGPARARDAADAFRDTVEAFSESLARALAGREASRARRVETEYAQAGYAAAHRTDDKGLGVLARAFGAAWAERYVREVLFPGPAGGDGGTVP